MTLNNYVNLQALLKLYKCTGAKSPIAKPRKIRLSCEKVDAKAMT